MAEHRASFNRNRTILGEKLPLKIPFSVRIDTSERCNFKCNYCFRSGKREDSWGFASSNELMTLETFKQCLMQLEEFSEPIKMISLSGHGEPLCNPHLADMALLLKNSGICKQIDMHTNASLLTEENASEIAKCGFTRIVISLQGLNADAYRRTCGVKIDFEKFYYNLKLLYENKNDDLQIHIKIADTALRKEHFQEDSEQFYAVFDNIADYTFIEKIVPIWENSIIEGKNQINKFNESFGEVNYCPLLFYTIMITPQGEAVPCTHLPPPAGFGNIFHATVQEIWNSQQRICFLKEHLRQTRHQFKPCKNCYTCINCIMSKEDIIDPYASEILSKLEEIKPDGE